MALIVFTKPRQEQRARQNLERQGFKVFLPLCVEGNLPPQPLFPRYLFVYLGGLHFGKIGNTFGVCYIIKNENTPSEIPEDVIAEIKSRMVNGVVKLEARPERTFKKNQKIRIMTGKFAEMDGLFVKREKDRITALISMMGRQMFVKVPEKNIAY